MLIDLPVMPSTAKSATRPLLSFTDPNSISLILDLNIFKLSLFKHHSIQFSLKTHEWANYNFAPNISHFYNLILFAQNTKYTNFDYTP